MPLRKHVESTCAACDGLTVSDVRVGLRGRLVEKKALIVIAAQEDGKGIGHIRLRQIPDASAESLHTFVRESIQPGSVVHTDGWSGYSGLSAKGYLHEVTVIKGKKETASEMLPRVSPHRLGPQAMVDGNPPRRS